MSHATSTSTSTSTRTSGSRLRYLAGQLWIQVIIGAVLGVALGVLAPDVAAKMAPLNEWFIGLIKMIVVPVIFCVMVTGIASMDNLRKAGRIGGKALGYFLVLSLLSMLIGMAVANVFRPGDGMNINPSSLDTGAIPEGATEAHASFTAFISSLVPTNLVGAITADNLLAALVVSVLFGVALNMGGSRAGRWSTGSTPFSWSSSALSDG